MRKSGWAAATGLGSLVLLLAACGGSSASNSAAGAASGLPSASSGSSVPAAAATSVSAASTASQGGGGSTAKATVKATAKATVKASATPHHSVGPQPSTGGADQSIPPQGTTVMIVQKSAIGYVLAEANHQVVYIYDKDTKGGLPTCTGTCAQTWLPATGMPQAGPADHFPAQFGLVKGAGGVEQITYGGMPLYLLKGAKPLLTTGDGQGGVWHVVKLSASDVG